MVLANLPGYGTTPSNLGKGYQVLRILACHAQGRPSISHCRAYWKSEPHLLTSFTRSILSSTENWRKGEKCRNPAPLGRKALREMGKEKAYVFSWRRLERKVHHTILDLTCFSALSQVLMSSWSIRCLYLKRCKSIILLVTAILFPVARDFKECPGYQWLFSTEEINMAWLGGSFGHGCSFSP